VGITNRVKNALKAQALRRGIHVTRVPFGRHGDAFADQANLLDHVNVRRIFDVGAYHGETALRYRALFPNAEIHCFEPVPAAFTRLEEALAGTPLITANMLAVSDTAQPIKIQINRFSATSSRLQPSKVAERVVGNGLLDVVGSHTADGVTIDQYCGARGIDRIEVLKLDIQGGELAALRGAAEMIQSGKILIVYTELLVNDLYNGQPGVGELLTTLERHDYRLHGVYNLVYGLDTALYQMDAILTSPLLSAAR
jgi:FkbM family methyltransferase